MRDEGRALKAPVLDLVEIGLEGKDDHSFAAVRFDVGEQVRDLDSGDDGNLAAEAFPALGDEARTMSRRIRRRLVARRRFAGRDPLGPPKEGIFKNTE